VTVTGVQTCALPILKTAFHLQAWAACAVFIAGVVLSFTYDWWCFIAGSVLTMIIWRTNQKSAARKLLDLVLRDQACYTVLMEAGAWIYNIKDEQADSIYGRYRHDSKQEN
jgi:membrane protein implicated in regulation of membrane protease activity